MFGDIYHYARNASRVKLGVSAVAAASTAAVAVGLSAGPPPASGPAGHAATISHIAAASNAGHGAAVSDAAGSPASGHPAVQTPTAHRAPHATHSVRVTAHARPAVLHKKAAHRAPKKAVHAAIRHPVARSRSFLIYDSVTPAAIPAHHVMATYATGNYAATAPRATAGGPALRIDTIGRDYSASVLDVEPGDATPSVAAAWAWHRLKDNPSALAHIYTMRSEWPAVQAAVSHLPSWMRGHVRWWIADPTGTPHLVPGSEATQWYWGKNYDISTASPNF
jgi:hypothetical protein